MWGEKSKKLRMEFLRRRHRTFNSSLKLDSQTRICLLMNRVVGNSHSALSTAFYKELKFVRVWFCGRQAPWTTNNMLFLGETEQVSDPNSEFLVSFSYGTPCLYKEK